MRNSLQLSLVLIVLSMGNIFAQDDVPLARTVFKLSPQHFTQNALKAGVERFNQNHSSSFAIFITGTLDNNENNYYDGTGYDGLAGEFQIRKYISPMKQHTSKRNNVYNQGVYGAAYVQGGSYSGDFVEEYSVYDPSTGEYQVQNLYDYHESIGNWGVGFTIGYQKTLWQVMFLEAFIGGGIQFSDKTVTGVKPDDSMYYDAGIIDPGYKGILPKIGLHIGIGL